MSGIDEMMRRISESFNQQSAMATLGVVLEQVETGQVTLSLSYAPHILQQQGFIHGGVICSVLDSACGYSALSVAPDGHEVLTIELKTSFLRPASLDRLLVKGRVLKAGRRISYTEAEAFTEENNKQILVAKMSSTLAIVPI